MKIHTNGKLRSIVLPSGAGGLFYDWVALTRFSESAPNACGPRVYLRDADNREPDDLTVSVEAGISASADVEIREFTLTNHSSLARAIELTTYAEIALNHPAGDAGHPAFSKLFVQTSITDGVLLARRRPRGMNEHWPWMAQCLIAENPSWETNRATFLGRGRTPADPAALDQTGALSGQTGNVLDPVLAWRCPLALGPNETKTVRLLTAAAADETAVLAAIRNATDALIPSSPTRAEELAATMLLGR